jgi:arsenate reductase
MNRVLFICVHNSARSQMAEGYLKLMGADSFQVESAGFDPREINPLVVEVMAEDGVDLSEKKPQKVFDLFQKGRIFDYVITVCSESVDEMCPIFPGMTHRLHLPFDDPSKLEGPKEELLVKVRIIRDQIKQRVREFTDWIRSGGSARLGDDWEIKKPGA